MKVLFFLPAYNEEKTIARVIQTLPRTIAGVEKIDILVFNDGSTDSTSEIARQSGVKVIDSSRNIGLGKGFRLGIEKALTGGYDIMVNIDADGQFNGKDVIQLLWPVLRGEADLVTASRFIKKEYVPEMPKFKEWGNRAVSFLVSVVTGQKFYDVSCGFRAYSREALLHLNLFGSYTYTHETILNLAFKGLSILEVPIQVRGEREFGESKIAKNLWRYGYNIFNTIFRTVLDYKPLKFFGFSGLGCFILGLLFDIFVGLRLLELGRITPYKTMGVVGLSLNIFGVLLMIIGLVADMINRVRITQERSLYLQKKKGTVGRNKNYYYYGK